MVSGRNLGRADAAESHSCAPDARGFVWTGVIVAALFGCLAGLGEAARDVLATRRFDQFITLAGYGVLVNAAIFALLGASAAALWALACRLRGAGLDRRRLLQLWLPVGFVVVAGLLIASAQVKGGAASSVARAEGLLIPARALPSLGLLLAAVLLSWLSVRALAWLDRSPLARLPIPPLVLTACLGVSGLIVLQDLLGLGLELGDRDGAAAIAAIILAACVLSVIVLLVGRGAGAGRETVAGSEAGERVHASRRLLLQRLGVGVASLAVGGAAWRLLAESRAASEAASRALASAPTAGPTRAPATAAPLRTASSLAPTASAAVSPTTAPVLISTSLGPPNVVLITVDTLRADHLGIYGHARAATPNMDRLGTQGVMFRNAVVQQPATNASHATLFSGAYPITHGARAHMLDTLSTRVVSLAEHMAASGYSTAGLYSWVSLDAPYSGLDRGFDTYENYAVNVPAYLSNKQLQVLSAGYKKIVQRLALPGLFDHQMGAAKRVEDVLDGKADVTTDAAVGWLVERRQDPFLLWVHYFDPHYPYAPPSPFDTMYVEQCDSCIDGSMKTIDLLHDGLLEPTPAEISRLRGLYDGEIAYTDQEVGRLLGALQDLDLADNTLVILTGDHGEAFGDHGRWFHGGALYQSEIHVPLLMRYPNGLPAGTVVKDPAGLLDVMPTTLDLLQLPIPRTVEGSSLLPLLRGEEAPGVRTLVAEVDETDFQLAALWRNYKLILDTTTWKVELYDLERDPHEVIDRAAAEPDVRAHLSEVLDRWIKTHW